MSNDIERKGVKVTVTAYDDNADCSAWEEYVLNTDLKVEPDSLVRGCDCMDEELCRAIYAKLIKGEDTED